MLNLFISQPTNGKLDKEIQKAKEIAIAQIEDMFGESVKVIDSFIVNAPKDANPIWYLGQSILRMSQADVVYFTKGWREARECVIENTIANEYKLCCVQTD